MPIIWKYDPPSSVNFADKVGIGVLATFSRNFQTRKPSHYCVQQAEHNYDNDPGSQLLIYFQVPDPLSIG